MIEIQSSGLLVTVLPEVGGKIAQIRDRASGLDLLIPPRRPYRTIPLDGDWLEHDTSGMDEHSRTTNDAIPEPMCFSEQLEHGSDGSALNEVSVLQISLRLKMPERSICRYRPAH